MRAELQQEEKVLIDFLRSIGDWRNHLVIGGGYAPIVYKLYLADRNILYPPVGTRDLDSLIPRRMAKSPAKNLSKHLFDANFKLVFKDHGNPATEGYVKEIDNVEIEIEFLTDALARENEGQNVTIAGIVAQPLSYLSLSLINTIAFTTSTHEKGLVVSPGAWIFHKGLTFPRRTDKPKIYKDLYGIWYVATQLGFFSERAINELQTLFSQHTKWAKTFRSNMHDWVQAASVADWKKLEAQDPFGRLHRSDFEQLFL